MYIMHFFQIKTNAIIWFISVNAKFYHLLFYSVFQMYFIPVTP